MEAEAEAAAAEAESQGAKVRYVYIQTALQLWRFDFEGTDPNYVQGYENPEGLLTKLVDFRKDGVPLGAGGFVWNSMLFFVGGETVKPDTIRVRLLPLRPFETDEEFNSIYDFEQGYSDSIAEELWCYDSLGYLKLPRSSLNRRVFVLDPFSGSDCRPAVYESESRGPKTLPFVIPIKKGDKTLVYVIAATPRYYKFDTGFPSFEVFDPDLGSWETLPEPPYQGRGSCYAGTFFPARYAFELGGSIFLFAATSGAGLLEMSFDVETRKWDLSDVFEGSTGYVPMFMIHVFDDIYLGCMGCTALCAYKYSPGEPIRIQSLIQLCYYCAPEFPYCMQPISQLCNLGGGEVLYLTISVGDGEEEEDEADDTYLRFHFVKLRISLQQEGDPGYSVHDFVKAEFVDSLDKRVFSEGSPLLADDAILQIYRL